MGIKQICYTLLGVLFVCTACSQTEDVLQKYSERPENSESTMLYRDTIDQSNVQTITDDSMTQFFRDLYGMKSLLQQRVYWNGSEIQVEYYFEKEVTGSEIDAARSFALSKFVLGLQNRYSASSYEYWMQADGKIRKIPKVKCKIIVEDSLIFQDNYQSGQLTGCYENSEVFLQARKTSIVGESEFENYVERQMKPANIYIQKSIKSSSLIIGVELKGPAPIKKLENVEHYIADIVAADNINFPKIILSISWEGSSIFCATYNNEPEKKQWEASD